MSIIRLIFGRISVFLYIGKKKFYNWNVYINLNILNALVYY